jgi:hypothetical protein
VYWLVVEDKSEEAMQVLDQILFLDETNVLALAVNDHLKAGDRENALRSLVIGFEISAILAEPLGVERVVVLIADLFDEGEIETAEFAARVLHDLLPEQEPAAQLAQAMQPTKQTEPDAAAVQALADEAAGRINSVLRAARLRAVLDARLVPFAEGEGFPNSLADLYDGPTPADTEWADGGALLSILLTDTSDATLASIRGLGVKIKATTERMKFIVAAVPLGRFDDLAMLEAVRRVEPVRGSQN